MYTNPTGGGVRNDRIGAGYWHSPRGSRLHIGVDLELPKGPGQEIVAPHSGIIVRYSFPYQGDTTYSGVLLEGASLESRIWYFQPFSELIGKQVRQGQPIGIAQDISKKYCPPNYKYTADPHIHWQIGKYGEIDPLILL